MDSSKAAAVRDAVNGCPDVTTDEDVTERAGRDAFQTTRRGEAVTITGDYLKPEPTAFRPAYIEEIGEIGDGDGRSAPVHAVILESLWTQHDMVRSLSPELVYEVAKHNCRIRFYPPGHRLEGDIWIVDPFHSLTGVDNVDGDRCTNCEATYFKLKDGDPVCARCGTPQADPATLDETTAIGARGGR